MKSEVDTSKAIIWCKEHPLVLGWFGGSIITSIGIGILAGSVGSAILSLGICTMFGIFAMAQTTLGY